MSQPEVTIAQGKLRGSVATTTFGETYFRFLGIPYAKPPVGKLRFKAPVAPEKWNGIFDATKEGDACYARDMIKQDELKGSENCLVLNVFTKKIDNNNLRPVLFWIHGGGFTSGSSNTEMYGPDFLLIEDVVIVSINYRLGLLGFLSFEDSTFGIHGNAAFKDMIMALKWVQKNINQFGGDPNNVTIFGESAGGVAIQLLYLSEMSKGLFHKAIAQSGSALNPWVRGKKGVKSIATAIGQDGADEQTIYKFLMEKSVEEIHQIQEKVTANELSSELKSFSLVIEDQTNEPAFLSDEPINIMRSGRFNQVPFMIGYTTAEGMLMKHLKNPKHSEGLSFEEYVPWYFGYQYGSPERKAVADKIKTFYFGSEEPSPKNIGKTYDMFTDIFFVHGIYVSIIKQSKTSKAPTYLYRMSVDSKLNLFKRLIMKITEPGVSHADDLGYLFKNIMTPEIEPNSLEDISFRRFVRLWTNFAKYGNPTPKTDDLLNVIWKPVTGPEIDFLDIGVNLTASKNPDAERMKFWENLYAESPAGSKVKN